MNTNFTNKDIINGRGQGVQRHPGNVMFRKLVNVHKQTYVQAPWKDKEKITKGIVAALRQFGARFLEFHTGAGCYREIEYKKALYKTSQALREGQADIRLELELAAAAGKKMMMGDSKSSSDATSMDTSTEESCANFSIQQLLRLLGEEECSHQHTHPSQDQIPPQKPKQTLSKQSPARALQQETNENNKPTPTLLRFVSDDTPKTKTSHGYELCDSQEGLTVDALRDADVARIDDIDVNNDGLKADAVLPGQSKHTVMDGSANLEASPRRVSESQLNIHCVELLNSLEAKLDAIRVYLAPTPDKFSSRKQKNKRKAADDLSLALGNDDDVVLTRFAYAGASRVAETVAKRVKVAEDHEEVMNILCEMKNRELPLESYREICASSSS
jgi:hypothetical protein